MNITTIDELFAASAAGDEFFPSAVQGTKRKLRHYERQKLQKQELEQQIADLTETLQHQQTEQKKKKKTTNNMSTTQYNSVWGVRAMRELNVWLASETQRRWLRAAIKGKTELVGDLKTVVRQHLKIASLIAAQSEGQSTEMFIEPTNDLLYAIDIQDINELYALDNSVFLLDSVPERGDFQRTMIADDNGVTVQYARKQHLMHSFKNTCESTWLLSHHLHRQENREDYPDIEDAETSLGAKFRITRRLPDGSRVSLTQRIVTRRFMKSDRMVIVWKAFIAGEGKFSGIQTDETGWNIIRPSTTGSGTVMELCLRQTPLHLNCGAPTISSPEYDDLLQSVIQESDREITGGAETVLFDDVLSGPGS